MRSSSECRIAEDAKRQADTGRLIVGTIVERSIGLSGWLAGGDRASFGSGNRMGEVILSVLSGQKLESSISPIGVRNSILFLQIKSAEEYYRLR